MAPRLEQQLPPLQWFNILIEPSLLIVKAFRFCSGNFYVRKKAYQFQQNAMQNYYEGAPESVFCISCCYEIYYK